MVIHNNYTVRNTINWFRWAWCFNCSSTWVSKCSLLDLLNIFVWFFVIAILPTIFAGSVRPIQPHTINLCLDIFIGSSFFVKSVDPVHLFGNSELSFAQKIEVLKNDFYLQEYGSDDDVRCYFLVKDQSFWNRVTFGLLEDAVVGDKHDIDVFGMKFRFDGDYNFYRLAVRDYSVFEVLCVARGFLRYMNTMNKLGYVNEKVLAKTFMTHFMSHLSELGFEDKVLGNSELPYTMWYNVIYINLYYLILDKLEIYKNNKEFKDVVDFNEIECDEIFQEFECVRVDILSRMDQYLKQQIQKRGITIIQNSYSGFDCEFKLLDEKKKINKLISSQTATQHRTILKIPLYHAYDISFVNPLSSEISDIFQSKVDNGNSYQYSFLEIPKAEVKVKGLLERVTGIRMERDSVKKKKLNEIRIINDSLKDCIVKIRSLLFSDLFDKNVVLINKLRELSKEVGYEDVVCYDDLKRDQFIFTFPLTPLKSAIVYPRGKDFKFSDLLDMSKNEILSPEKLNELYDNINPYHNSMVQTNIKTNSFFTPNSVSDGNSNLQTFSREDLNSKLIGYGLESSRGEFSVEPSLSSKTPVLVTNRGGGDGNVDGCLSIPLNANANVHASTNVNEKLNDNEEKKKGYTNNYIGSSTHEDFIFLVKLFTNLGFYKETKQLLSWYYKSQFKGRSRTKIQYKGFDISLSIIKNLYIIGHYNAADLPMLSDFDDDLKLKLSVVNKSFVSIGKPLKFDHGNVYVRDTILLAPAGKGSLASLGKLYESEGDFNKRSITPQDLNDMESYLERDPIAFEEYAIQDAVITLKHALAMEKFNMSVQQLGIPLTLSSVGRNYVFNEWKSIFDKHLPYQISGEFLMGNADEIQTPKGLFASRDIGAHLSYFIANYKGGRNESFMYGCDQKTHWYDYDLTSAYTTGMADLALPDYFKGSLIDHNELDGWTAEQFLTGYLIVNGDFKFPENTKYPSIPCYIDKTTTLYPLNGSCFVTGPEFWLAKRQGCEFNIKSAFYIHPKTTIVKEPVFDNVTNVIIDQKEVTVTTKPFHDIIKNIQAQRRKHPKGTINNLLYKEMGNSIYGNVVRGMSNKKSFDSISGKSFRVTATELSNPILASWITAFVRSVIGECLHNIHKLGGKVVSVTTDGFITDLEDLENKIMTLPEEDRILLNKYRSLRCDLTEGASSEGLEIKTTGVGIISWTTRGQLGFEGGMTATTGFQRGGYVQDELVSIFKNLLSSKEKFVEYTRKSLRGAKDIFEGGGHVTMELKDQIFRLFYDNRRRILDDNYKSHDLSKILLDSEPLKEVSQCKSLRFLSKFSTTKPFNKNNANKAQTSYKTSLEVGVRNFIKGYYSTNEKYGLTGNEFNYVKDLIKFISGHKSTKGIRISTSSISKLKNRKLTWKPVPHTNENIAFAEYIKFHYPNFKTELFLKDI